MGSFENSIFQSVVQIPAAEESPGTCPRSPESKFMVWVKDPEFFLMSSSVQKSLALGI